MLVSADYRRNNKAGNVLNKNLHFFKERKVLHTKHEMNCDARLANYSLFRV